MRNNYKWENGFTMQKYKDIDQILNEFSNQNVVVVFRTTK